MFVSSAACSSRQWQAKLPCASSSNRRLAPFAPGSVAYGITSILLITPLIALAVLRLPLQPPELALGLAVFCCMPTALSSGVALTTVRLCGGVWLQHVLIISVVSEATTYRWARRCSADASCLQPVCPLASADVHPLKTHTIQSHCSKSAATWRWRCC